MFLLSFEDLGFDVYIRTKVHLVAAEGCRRWRRSGFDWLLPRYSSLRWTGESRRCRFDVCFEVAQDFDGQVRCFLKKAIAHVRGDFDAGFTIAAALLVEW